MIQSIPLGNAVWQKNIEILRRQDAPLAHRLTEAVLDPERLKYILASDGRPVLGIRQSGDRFLGLDDPHAPRAKAEDWLNRIVRLNLQNGHIMLVGIGTGYHALTLFEQSSDRTFLWLVEPDASLLKAAFHLTDFSSLLESPRVRFLSGCTPEEAAASPFDGVTGNRMRAQGIEIQYPPTACALYEPYIQSLKDSIQQTARVEAMKVKTMEAQGWYCLRNSVSNLPFILQGTPFLRLLGAGAGLPIVITGPGPSLEEAAELLKPVRKRIILLAIDTALRCLYRMGIEPDAVVSVDFSDLNARHFDGVPISREVLIASPAVHPRITERYAGRTFFFSHHATRLINSLSSLGALGTVDVLGSTAHAAYGTARQIGGSPIILVGIDLSFPKDRQYADGTIQNELTNSGRPAEPPIEITANDGTRVPTILSYAMFRDTLARQIRESHGHAINTSLHGARIPGCPYMALDEVLRRYAIRDITPSIFPKELPSLERKRTAVVEEIRGFLAALDVFRKRIDALIHTAAPLDVSRAELSRELDSILQDFYRLQEWDGLRFALCTPLCPAATIRLFGAPESFAVFERSEAKERKAAKNSLVASIQAFGRAAESNIEALQAVLPRLA